MVAASEEASGSLSNTGRYFTAKPNARIPAEKIYCEGCMTGGNPKLIDTVCPVRPCVIKKGLNNCSECDEYPCEKFNQRAVTYEEIVKDRKDITESDRKLFIKPYENMVRLNELKRKRAGSSDY